MAQAAKSLKFGWLLLRSDWAIAPAMRLLIAGLMLAGSAAPAPAQGQSQRILFAGGQWAAIDFGSRCEARSGALWARRGTSPLAGFAFDRDGPRQGVFYVRLSRPARDGASVIATIGSQPFLLSGKGEWAWGRGAEQRQALLEVARYGTSMRVESRDRRGSRIVDRYLLSGAPTAIDAAAAACAGKSR